VNQERRRLSRPPAVRARVDDEDCIPILKRYLVFGRGQSNAATAEIAAHDRLKVPSTHPGVRFERRYD
jgi:hypothetical protein